MAHSSQGFEADSTNRLEAHLARLEETLDHAQRITNDAGNLSDRFNGPGPTEEEKEVENKPSGFYGKVESLASRIQVELNKIQGYLESIT